MTTTESFETLMPEPYAWHYWNSGGATVYHRGPSKRLEADLEAAEIFPRVHHIERLYTAEQMRAMFDAAKPQWQSIESAPKHTEVLVWREDSGSFIAKLTTPDAVLSERELEHAEFPEDFEEWFSDAYGWQEGSEKPTHWRPLDEPSAAAIRAREDGVAG